MAKLKSSVIALGVEIKELSVINTKQIMPIGGDMHLWYGKFIGDAAELKAKGMLIPANKLLENLQAHSGIITVVAAEGDIFIHSVD